TLTFFKGRTVIVLVLKLWVFPPVGAEVIFSPFLKLWLCVLFVVRILFPSPTFVSTVDSTVFLWGVAASSLSFFSMLSFSTLSVLISLRMESLAALVAFVAFISARSSCSLFICSLIAASLTVSALTSVVEFRLAPSGERGSPTLGATATCSAILFALYAFAEFWSPAATASLIALLQCSFASSCCLILNRQ